jgi:GT2 family glycosyltransferase
MEMTSPGSIADRFPCVQVIIVTWNREEDVVQLLDQLKELDYPGGKYEIVVVDNNSSDNTVRTIESRHPSVVLIRNDRNLGGAGGFNVGMRWVLSNRAYSRYMWLLDNDVHIDRDALKELVAVLENHQDAGMCGSRIMNIVKPNEVLEVGASIDYHTGRSRSNMPQDDELNDKQALFEVDYVSACSLLVRTELVRKIGLLNDHLFLYWDDKDWGVRFNNHGWKVLACNTSIVYHPDWPARREADNSNIWRSYYGLRNCLWFFNNHTAGMKRRIMLARIVIQSMKSALQSCLNARSTLCMAIIEAVQDFFKGSYGRKFFEMPPEDIIKHIKEFNVDGVCVFFSDGSTSQNIQSFLYDLVGKYPEITVFSIVPEQVSKTWADLFRTGDTLVFRRSGKGTISWAERLRITRFLWRKAWTILLIPPRSFTVAGIGSRHVAVVDFEKGVTISIEKANFVKSLSIPIKMVSFLMRALAFPPNAEMHPPFV